jgi:hypothetical protein
MSSRFWRSERAIFMGSMREHGLAAPLVEKFARPGGRAILPELLEGLFVKVSPDGLQVIPEQFAQAEALFGLKILFAIRASSPWPSTRNAGAD